MPELPEIETIKLGLTSRIKGAVFDDVLVRQPKLRVTVPDNLANKVKGCKVIALRRRGKYLLLDLTSPANLPLVSTNANANANATAQPPANKRSTIKPATLDTPPSSDVYTIIIHLGMSGSFTIHGCEGGSNARDNSGGSELGKNAYTKHDHIIFKFTDIQGSRGELRYNDPRRFGLVDIVPTAEVEQYKYIKNLGIEPLTEEFNGAWLYKALAGKSVAIKPAIMNANLVVGVGNIYANEALFSAKIHPLKPAGEVTKQACTALCKIIKQTLKEAIAAGGSSLRDHRQADGTLGYFQHNFKAYGKAGQACGVCDEIIEKAVQGGRATFFCSNCQKK